MQKGFVLFQCLNLRKNNLKSTTYIITAFACLILFCNTSANAQERFFDAYLLAGPNFTQVDGDRFGGYNKLGFHGGIGISHEYNENWSGGFEIMYTTKGSKRRIDPEDVNPQIFILKSQYVEFPIVARYKLTSIPALSFVGGLSFGVNVGGTVDDGIVREANFKKSEIAFHLGGAYKFQEKYTIQLRHSNSLFRVGDTYPNGLNIFNRVGLYNRMYMASIIVDL